jgi:branched-chain amino acid transport system substrate-binding protein
MKRVTVAAALATVLVIAGCGGTPTAASGQAPQGEPIVIGLVNTDTTAASLKSSGDGLEAWAKARNAAGGLVGRPIEVRRCDDAGDPQKAADCVRRMVDDPAVVALAGSASRQIGTNAALIEGAKMPLICTGTSALELNISTAFCLRGGPVLGTAAIIDQWRKEGVGTNIQYLASDSAAGHAVTDSMNTVQKALGAPLGGAAFVSQNSPDFLPSAQAIAATGASAIMLGVAPNATIQLLQAFQTIGTRTPLGTSGSSVNAALIASSASNGLYTDNTFPSFDSTDPGMTAFKDGMAAADLEKEIDIYSLAGWLCGAVLGNMVEQLPAGQVTRDGLLKIVQTGSVKGVPLLPETLSRANAPKSVPGFAGLANPTTHVVKVTDGKLQEVGTFTMP